MKKILIVEDEIAIARVLKAYLEKEGFDTVIAYDGENAIEQFQQKNPNLVILDVMLPKKDGWEVLKYIREKSACPIIMLTALSDLNYRLDGFQYGADDYITKPFAAQEVVARVKAVLKRPIFIMHEDEKVFGSLKINMKSHDVFLQGEPVKLTPRDLAVLVFLAKHPNQTFTRDQLIEYIWGIDYDGSDRAVDLAIKRLRKALMKWPPNEGEIKTLRGLGYQFCVYGRTT
ncbi:response regulator transcription factor [Anoxybacillus sp. J5B_2022]|uniref:response regulator transcription factor n=1 Tax=Anoxybacillus sp. J5B_2022 TaxID=3003246 RepID=UPI002285FB4A|nr:response regulator transcription factor [Anoxybacillus sp. J5B_2022]MCZ0756927.1 response regulator transcription factor [Anoxybacillus sp. J5B_2022]